MVAKSRLISCTDQLLEVWATCNLTLLVVKLAIVAHAMGKILMLPTVWARLDYFLQLFKHCAILSFLNLNMLI
jgi:hypothetical protein